MSGAETIECKRRPTRRKMSRWLAVAGERRVQRRKTEAQSPAPQKEAGEAQTAMSYNFDYVTAAAGSRRGAGANEPPAMPRCGIIGSYRTSQIKLFLPRRGAVQGFFFAGDNR